MVRKDDLLKNAAEMARLESKRRNLDKYTAENLIREAEDIINDLFMSLSVEKVEGSVIESTTHWRHRTASDMESDFQNMHFRRADLQNASERYLDRPWLHCRELDWFIVNILIYAEFQATLDFIRSRNMPPSRYMSIKLGSIKWQIASGLWRSVVYLVKWLMWLSVLVPAFQFSPVGPVIWTGITVLWQWRKWRAQKKVNDLLTAMIATYATLNTISMSWQVVWNELEKSRDTGAVWDGIVYRLVEERMR